MLAEVGGFRFFEKAARLRKYKDSVRIILTTSDGVSVKEAGCLDENGAGREGAVDLPSESTGTAGGQ